MRILHTLALASALSGAMAQQAPAPRIGDALTAYSADLREASAELAATHDASDVRRLAAWIDSSAYALAMDVHRAHKRRDMNVDYAMDLAMAEHFANNDAALADYYAYRAVDGYYKSMARITPAPYRELLYLSELGAAVSRARKEARYVRLRDELIEYAATVDLALRF